MARMNVYFLLVGCIALLGVRKESFVSGAPRNEYYPDSTEGGMHYAPPPPLPAAGSVGLRGLGQTPASPVSPVQGPVYRLNPLRVSFPALGGCPGTAAVLPPDIPPKAVLTCAMLTQLGYAILSLLSNYKRELWTENPSVKSPAQKFVNPEPACPCLTSVNSSTIPRQSDCMTQQRQHPEHFYTQNVMLHDGMICSCNLAMRGAPMRDDYHYTMGIGGHKLHTRAATWNDARKFCNEEGGHLAIINSIAEEKILLEIFNHSGAIKGAAYLNVAFLGIHDLYAEGEWVTVLGDSLAKTGFTTWSDMWGGQPDNGGGKQHCGALMKEGGMDDLECDVPFQFFCELPLMRVLK